MFGDGGTVMLTRFKMLAAHPYSTTASQSTASSTPTFVHPGLLRSDSDFDRIRNYVETNSTPWSIGWEKLTCRANPSYTPNRQTIVIRGYQAGISQKYAALYRDVAAAYALALRWKITGEAQYSDAARRILDAWSSTLTDFWGNSDRFLAVGIYGYQYANAAEILRGYDGWDGLDATISLMRNVFFVLNHRFLHDHNGAHIENYWANWDLCNIASYMGYAVLADNRTAWDEAVEYFKHGAGNGAIEKAIWSLHTEEDSGKVLGQGQEVGRYQGQATLDFALLAVVAQQAYNQGEDLFDYSDNRILAEMEYMASSIKTLNASWTKEYRDLVVNNSGGAEGGGGDYGSTSGGYDQLGFGTLLYRLEE